MKILIKASNYRDGTQSEYEHQSGLKEFIMNWQHWSNHCAINTIQTSTLN